MANSSGGGSGVPPGFRFHPTEEELLHFYLKKKTSFHKFDMEVIREVDLNKIEPWELQERCKIGSTPQNEWYFFSHKDRKYPTGSRTNRATGAGFWKATGRDKCIRNSFKMIGMRKTLVFYRGRAPHGQKTYWIMHEYRLEDSENDSQPAHEDGWVVCRVFKKKNLFKIGSGEGGEHNGGMMMNSCDQLNNSSTSASTSCSQSRSIFTQRNNTINQYLLHSDDLNYSHITGPPHHQYSPIEAQNFISTHNHIKPLMLTSTSNYDDHRNLSAIPTRTTTDYDNHQSPAVIMNMQVKQFMSSNTNTNTSSTKKNCDCSSPVAAGYQACEHGIECDQSSQPMVVMAARDDQNLNEWNQLVITASHNQDSNTTSSINQINQLSLRSEMDFWAYGK